jgi:hypothetical protein
MLSSAQTDAQNDANKAAFANTVKLTGAQRDLRDKAIRSAQIQDSAKASDEIRKNRERSERALGLARVSGSESGVAGGALAGVLADFQRQEAQEALTTLRNRDASMAAAEKNIQASELTTESTLLAAQPQDIAGPSVLGLLLGIGTGIAGADNDLLNAKIAAGEAGETVSVSFGESVWGSN